MKKTKSTITIDDFSISTEKATAYFFNSKSKSDQVIERSMDLCYFDNYVLNLFGVDKNKMIYEINHDRCDHNGNHVQDEIKIPVTILDLYDRLDNSDVETIFEKHRKAIFSERVIMRSKSSDIVDGIQNLIKRLK